MTSKRPLVLIAATVDSGGGAGITADILSIHDHGAWGLPLVNAVSSQSLKRVAGIENISAAMFSNMLDVALSEQDLDLLERTLNRHESTTHNKCDTFANLALDDDWYKTN